LRRADSRSFFEARWQRISSTTGQRRKASAVAARRSGSGHRTGDRTRRPRRGFVMFERPRARFVETRKLADGTTAFYFRVPTYYRKLGCEIANEPLGTSYEAACGEDGKGGRLRSIPYSMNGTTNTRASRSSRRRSRAMAALIGCSGNTRPRRLIQRRSRRAHAPTTNGSCR
jgi:hypothetical protein